MNIYTATSTELEISSETLAILQHIAFRSALFAVRKSESSNLIVEAKAHYIEIELLEDIQVTHLKMNRK